MKLVGATNWFIRVPFMLEGLIEGLIGGIIAFAVVTESVFQWPGMGFLLVQAINFADIPVMSAYLVLVSLFFVLINLVVDLIYAVVDPRLRVQLHRAER